MIGSEHLSALQEVYLQQLSAATGLHYSRLIDGENLQQALQQSQLATVKNVQIGQHWQFALLAFFLMMLIYVQPFHDVLNKQRY